MPATTPRMQRFMGMCAHTDHPPARCPSQAVAEEFSHAPAGGYDEKAVAKARTRKLAKTLAGHR